MRIKQVLTNILSNAIKYTQKGSVTLFVESEQTGADEILLKMAVIDTGMGIRQDDMKYLFDSFKRVNEGSTKGIEGTGLGLSICSQLVNLMGGQITVDSIYQKGSTFTITIPQKIVNATPLEISITTVPQDIRDPPIKRVSKHRKQKFLLWMTMI